jgi:hypothetical protein
VFAPRVRRRQTRKIRTAFSQQGAVTAALLAGTAPGTPNPAGQTPGLPAVCTNHGIANTPPAYIGALVAAGMPLDGVLPPHFGIATSWLWVRVTNCQVRCAQPPSVISHA